MQVQGSLLRLLVVDAIAGLALGLALPASQPAAADVSLPPGLVYHVYADSLFRPGHLVTDELGNLFVAVGLGDVASRPTYCIRGSDGQVFQSSAILDPDGIDVHADGRVFVAGGNRISTYMRGFPPWPVSVFASGFANLNAIALDEARGRTYVMENNGRLVVVSPRTILADVGIGGPIVVHNETGAVYFGDQVAGGGIYKYGPPLSLFSTARGNGFLALAPGMGTIFPGFLFASQPDSKTIVSIDEGGSSINFATFTDDPGTDATPAGIAFAKDSVLFVSQPNYHRTGGLGRIIAIHSQVEVEGVSWSAMKELYRGPVQEPRE